eukprot:2907890-Amphidinium_carterae.1
MVGRRIPRGLWWQQGIFTDDKCTQPLDADYMMNGMHLYDPTVINGYSEDACITRHWYSFTDAFKIKCVGTGWSYHPVLYSYQDPTCSGPAMEHELGCKADTTTSGGGGGSQKLSYAQFITNAECSSSGSMGVKSGAPATPPAYPGFHISNQPTAPPPLWATTTTTTPAGPVWSIHFYDDHGCANFSGPGTVDKNPFIGSATGCTPISAHGNQYYVQQSGCLANGSGVPTFKSYDDANCTHLVEQIRVPAQGTCTVFHGSMVAFCHSQTVPLAFAQISTIATST